MIWLKFILKWISIGFGALLLLYINTHPWLNMNSIERYVLWKTWAENVKSHKFNIEGQPTEKKYYAMNIIINGSSDLVYIAFNPYCEKERWKHDMSELSESIISKLKEKDQIDFHILEIMVTTSKGSRFRLFGNMSTRTRTYFHYID